MSRVDDAATATARERTRRMFAETDAITGKAFYATEGSAAETESLAEDLDAAGDCVAEEVGESETEAGYGRVWVWLCPEGEVSPTGVPGRRVLGNVREGAGNWCVEAFSRANLERLKEAFVATARGRVRFVSERIDDLGQQIVARDPAPDQTLVVPELTRDVGRLDMSSSRVEAEEPEGLFAGNVARALAEHWLDTAVPVLGDRTPREAAAMPELRETLLRLLKGYVRNEDRRALKEGRRAELAWMFEELDLPEIAAEDPPSRAADDDDVASADFGQGEAGEAEADRPSDVASAEPVPVLAGRPLEQEEVELRERRMGAACKEEPTLHDALSERSADLVNALETALEETLDPPEPVFDMFLEAAVFAFDLLAGTDLRARVAVDPSLLVAEIHSGMRELRRLAESDEEERISQGLREWMMGGRQPEIMRSTFGYLVRYESEELEKAREPVETLLWLRAAIDVIDARLMRFTAERRRE